MFHSMQAAVAGILTKSTYISYIYNYVYIVHNNVTICGFFQLSIWYSLESSGKGVSVKGCLEQAGLWEGLHTVGTIIP